MLETIGDQAPQFTLRDSFNNTHTLSQYRGSWVLLYFYPQDNTSGCTEQACAFRDSFSQFNEFGVKLFGISPDTVESHQGFQEEFSVPYTLLADPDKETISRYGMWQPDPDEPGDFETSRSIILIDPQGFITKIYRDVHPVHGVEHVLGDLKSFN